MDWQNDISLLPNEWTGKVIVLSAEPGEARRLHLQQWLGQAESFGATTWLLSCDRDWDGPWAGLKDLLSHLLPQIQAHAPELLLKHDYELASVLPAFQQIKSVRNPSLTDTSPQNERVRNYPMDRAFRIVHGLIDLLVTWHERSGSLDWVIACDRFDQSGFLVRRFFTEIMRRRGQQLHLTLIVASDPTNSETIASQFDTKYLGKCMQLHLSPEATPDIDAQEMAQLAEELAKQVGEDPIELEIHAPRLIRYYLLSNQAEEALKYQIYACSIYTTRGFYEDALVYCEAALQQLKRYCPEDIQKQGIVYYKLYNCYAALGKPWQALQVIEEAITKLDRPEYSYHYYYMMAMLYARFLPDRDLAKAEVYLQQGLEELAKADLPQHTKIFRAAFNRNGLALVRQRQGRSSEAMEICRSCFEQLNTHLKPDEHLLHRSVLVFNIAQVYGSTGLHEEAIAYLTSAMAMDPNYSEYYNDRGNLYMKQGRGHEALQDYLRAIDLSPPYWEVWSNLGRCYQLLGNITAAIDAYSTSIDLDPNQFSVLVARAQAFETLEQKDAALADYNLALNLDPNQPLLLGNRAILHYEMEHWSDALTDLNSAIALSPDTPDLYQNRAVVLSAMGHIGDAVRDLQAYLTLNPDAEDRQEIESQISSFSVTTIA